jgi:Flp pilus assembly protein TadD
MIQYSTASADVRTLLNKADTPARARQLLDKGFVYDAIAAISAQIEAAPNNASLREERAALLEQIGQTDAAKIERSTK